MIRGDRLAVLMFIISLLLISISMFSATNSLATADTESKTGADEISAIRIVNTTRVYIKQRINITTLISNPTTWILKNLSFSFTLPLETKIIAVLNGTDDVKISSKIIEEEEYFTVKVNISMIPIHSVFAYWVIVSFNKTGEYKIGSSEITFVKQKGELEEEDTISCPEITIRVYEKQKPIPPEGEMDFSYGIIFFTIILPLIIMSIAHKIARTD